MPNTSTASSTRSHDNSRFTAVATAGAAAAAAALSQRTIEKSHNTKQPQQADASERERPPYLLENFDHSQTVCPQQPDGTLCVPERTGEFGIRAYDSSTGRAGACAKAYILSPVNIRERHSEADVALGGDNLITARNRARSWMFDAVHRNFL